MRNLYIILTISIILMVLLLVFAFIMLEKEKHQDFFYEVKVSGEVVGYIEIDRYKTEEKVIYKSTAFGLKEMSRRITHEKFVFDKKDFTIERYIKEIKNFEALTNSVYLRFNNAKSYDFLAKNDSKFSVLSGRDPMNCESVFEEASVTSAMTFIDKYNFSRGGAQSFNFLHHSSDLLPPTRGKVVFKSIRDDYINVLGKKRKTECLVVKAKEAPEYYVWVSKNERAIVRLENKTEELLIEKVAARPRISFGEYSLEGDLFDVANVLFPSGDIALSGTMSIPKKEGKLPAVLLVAGEGPFNRENAGLYVTVSKKLADSGYAVLRFDKRGLGDSQGDYMSSSLTDEVEDIENAIKFLMNHERIDKDSIFVVSHSQTCSYLPKINFSEYPLKGLVMLAITKGSVIVDFECDYVESEIKARTQKDQEYGNMLKFLEKETLAALKSTDKNYTSLQGKRVFLKKMREIQGYKTIESLKKLEVPTLIIHSKKDNLTSTGFVKDVEKSITGAGREHNAILYFRDLGHFLGELKDVKGMVSYLELNQEVLEAIIDWINRRCADDLTNA